MEFNKDNLALNLPDTFSKDSNSNNFKILEVERLACVDLRENLQDISNILDINNAEGKTLDMYGNRVGQQRGLADDDKYLLMIKAKIMQNLTNGSYPNILSAICSTFGCEPSQVLFVENENECSVTLASLPLSIINHAGFTTTQTVALIKRLLPIGISLGSFLFEGTFEFGSTADEYDETKGFADIDSTIGGYFGATGGDESDIILPI